MNWFRENAAIIQALSSAAGLAITAVLAWLTWRYVCLTREIATSSLEQVKHIREAGRVSLRQNATALKFLALRTRTALGQQLNPDTANHKQLRAVDFLTDREIVDLQTLAREVNDVAITSASDAAQHLRVIHGMVQTAKQIDEAMGWIPTHEEAGRWKKAIEGAHRALQEIETACDRVAQA
jgi:hypothetical protein